MTRVGIRSWRRGAVLAAVLALVIGGSRPSQAQGSSDWAVDQAQRAVRQQIATQERNSTVQFTRDARTDSANANLRVRGTGTATRDDRKTRSFSYDAVVNTRTSNVSNVHHDWSGDWHDAQTNRLTGSYRLNRARSDDAGATADRATRNLPRGDQQRLRNAIMRRLEAPESLDIERDGRTITLASSTSRSVTFEADGREQSEPSGRGRSMRTTAVLSGERLVVSTDGDRSDDYQVTFEPMANGRSLRVTRRVTDEGLRNAVVGNSVYDKTADTPQFAAPRAGRDANRSRNNDDRSAGTSRNRSAVPDGTELVATLNDAVSTKQTRDGDRVTLSVRSPSQFAGSTINGYVVRPERSGQVQGRAEVSFVFDGIRVRDGRDSEFAGSIESVRTPGGDELQVDTEGRVQDDDSQTTRTVQRTGIGAAIGAVIGAVSSGGKGAAIGAAVGGGAGAGSVVIQGRDDLELPNGTEFRIRTLGPR